MRYVITGASGFIGIELCKYLLANGDTVYAVCRKESGGIANLPHHENMHLVWADLDHISRIPDTVDHADVFIHLAWQGTISGGRFNADIQRSNIDNALIAMSVANRLGCRVFVESGSQAEYGTVTDRIHETSPCNPFSDYGKAKLEVWNKGKVKCEEMGMSYIHLRIFSLFGENDHPYTLVMSLIDKLLRNEPSIDLSSCEQSWNYVYSADACRIIQGLSEYAYSCGRSIHEVYNVASDDTRKLKEFVERIKVLTGSESFLNYGAVTPANLVTLNPDISKVRKVVDLDFTPFDTVIRRIIQKLS